MIGEFDNIRGRGISIGGFGGMGKTELAIHIVSRLHQQGRFKAIYSGSAKQTVLGSTGPQQADPVFIDLRSFLIDLSGWLGLNTNSNSDIESLKVSCISGLKNHGDKKILIFVDNLETVQDRELFEFLDNGLPDNCWLLATARVHKLRRYLAPFELLPMIEGDDAARLLRHELKRQGLNELAGSDIKLLKVKAANLAHHPLAIRWFAWSCKKDRFLWDKKSNLLI